MALERPGAPDAAARGDATCGSEHGARRAPLAALFERTAFAPLRDALREAVTPLSPPKRIAEAIARSEFTAEIVVGWVQLAGVALFGLLYVLSHGAFAARDAFEPAPLLLLAYAAFVTWRMRRAFRGALSPRLLSLAAAADVLVLMTAIWSFTLQYDAPAALYLKGPTLLYAFILIALRALRTDPGHVLLTGTLTAIGWFVLTLVAAQSGAPLTNDYVTYMTSLSVLWGDSFERIAAIVATTLVLTLAVSRARRLLVSTATEEIAATDLSKFLDRGAAARVRTAEAALQSGDGEVKQAAILFLDLRGFSNAAAMLDPRGAIALLQDYQRRFVPIIEAAGGAVDKFLGDGILVSFGTARMTGRAAAEAFEVLPAIQAAAEAWAAERAASGLAPVRVAAAIAAGDVIHGVIGHADRLEFTVIGDAVNLAAKLEKHAKIENASAIATHEAYAAARAQGASIEALRIVRGARVEGVLSPIDLAILA